MLSRPWTFGDLSLHIANRVDYTTTPANGSDGHRAAIYADHIPGPHIALDGRAAPARGLG
jgi:hypothetical protein